MQKPPEQWVDNIEDIYALAEGFTIRIENISDTEQTLLTIDFNGSDKEDLTLTEIEDSGFRDLVALQRKMKMMMHKECYICLMKGKDMQCLNLR